MIGGIKRLLHVIKKYFVKQSVSFGTYKDLDVLIKRAVIRLGFSPRCRYGHGWLKFRMGKITGGGFNNTFKGSPIHEDQEYKCVTCFYTERFGVPLTRKQAHKEILLRKGTFLCVPIYRIDETKRQDVRERLKALGYLDFGD